MPLCSTCGRRKTGRRCPSCHATLGQQRRTSAHRRGYDHRWRTAAAAFLARPENRLCRLCPPNRPRLAQCVDHIRDHHGDPALFWDVSNWQPACIACNTRKANRTRSARS